MYYVSTTTHHVVSMERSHHQFPFVLRNAFMFKMNVPMFGANLNVYLALLDLASSTAVVQDKV